MTADPCGKCAACTEIDAGRFVDLMEVDAASRTKVDDTRELLDNVQYAPTRARYKVYLIDEVHMLSTHAAQVPSGSAVTPVGDVAAFSQFRHIAKMRAMVVLPTPRVQVKRNA
jgi:hypothetical protein